MRFSHVLHQLKKQRRKDQGRRRRYDDKKVKGMESRLKEEEGR